MQTFSELFSLLISFEVVLKIVALNLSVWRSLVPWAALNKCRQSHQNLMVQTTKQAAKMKPILKSKIGLMSSKERDELGEILVKGPQSSGEGDNEIKSR